MKSLVEFDKDSPDWLLCPNCREFYLHHDRVTVFGRVQADAPSTALEIEDMRVRVVRDAKGNPSSRRHGLAIRFWCEHCDVISELTVAQHKGITMVEWRYVGRELREMPVTDLSVRAGN